MWRALEAQGSHFEQATRLIEQAPGVSPPGQSPTLRQLRVALPAQRTSRAAKATPTVTSSIMCCLCRGGRIIARVEGQGRTANRTNASFVQFSGVPFSFQVRFGSLGVSITRPYDTSTVHLSINYWHQHACQFSSLFAVYELVRRSVNFSLLPKPIEVYTASSMRIWNSRLLALPRRKMTVGCLVGRAGR